MDKILNNIGLAYRAKVIVIGAEEVLKNMRNNNITYIFLANDAAKNTYKAVMDKASFYNVEVSTAYDSLALAHCLGKENVKVIGLTKKGQHFKQILRK